MNQLVNFVLSQGEQFRRARLPSLYSDFTLQRQANPDGFAANTAAWIDVLAKAARAGLLQGVGDACDTLSLRTGEELLQSLETKEWGRPLALGAVIDEAVSQQQMIPCDEFLGSRRSIYSRKWTVQPWWIFSWGLRQLGILNSSSTSGTLPTGRFVVVRNVEEAAGTILGRMAGHSNQMDRIYPMFLFSQEAAKLIHVGNVLTDSDRHVILTYLARDKAAIVYDEQTVKFKSLRETSTTLSDQDKTIASLRSLIIDMNVQVELLLARIHQLKAEAQTAVAKKNRVLATAALSSKKLNETALVQRSQTLSKLEEVYSKIEQAADQVAVMRVMEASSVVLKTLHKDVGGIEKVEDAVQALRDEMDNVDEIGSAIEAGGRNDDVVNSDEVDEELEQMLQQAEARDDEKEAQRTEQRLANIGPTQKDGLARNPGSQGATEPPKSPAQASLIGNEGTKAINRLSLHETRSLPTTHNGGNQAATPLKPNSTTAS